MERPRTPNEADCCGNACNPCIFDVHRTLVECWEKNQNFQTTRSENILNPLCYKIFYISDKIGINEDYCVIWLKCKEAESDAAIGLNPGQHVMLNLSTWTRPFTPISWTSDSLQLLVRIYKGSLFTNQLKNREIGEEIGIRGPYGDFQYSRNAFPKIIMFGIGSGVAAFYPIVKTITDDDLEETRIHMAIGFKSVELIPLKRELQLLTDFWNVDCTLHVSKLDKIRKIGGILLLHGRINNKIVEEFLKNEKPEKTLILVCGNKIFNETLKTCIEQCGFNNYHIFE